MFLPTSDQRIFVVQSFPSKKKCVSRRTAQTSWTAPLRTAGVFVAVGTVPDTALCEGKLQLTQDGYIAAGEDTHTSVPGIFAAGDVRKRPIYQIITACADGAVAAQQAGLFVRERKENA